MIIGDQIVRRQRYPRNLSFQYACLEQQLTKNNIIRQNINQSSLSQNQISPKFKNCFTPIVQITPTKEMRSRQMSFQNDYVSIAAKKHTIGDERKLLIKEKIKIKVKERFEETLKNNESIVPDQKFSEIKRQSISRPIYDVKIKGQAMKRSQRSILSCRRQNSKPNKLSNIHKRIKSEVPQKEHHYKLQTTDTSPRYKSKVGRSVAKDIRLRDIVTKKFTRKFHSAIDELVVLPKKNSFQIDPWNSAEDYM